MNCRQNWNLALLAVASLVAMQGVAIAQAPPRNQLREPVYRVSKNQGAAQAQGQTQQVQGQAQPEAKQHPLAPAVRMAKMGLRQIQSNVRDYSAVIVKRERIDGRLLPHEYMYAKVRNEKTDAQGKVTTPFSVYLYFLNPNKGREVLYVNGQNNNKLVAHDSGIKGIITVNLDPTGTMAMHNNRYPITEIGIENLVKKLIEVAEADMKYGECNVRFFKGAKVGKRTCTGIEVVHPVPRKNFRFHVAQIFIDDELQLPIRYAAYDWPKTKGGAPVLLEEYTYTELKINQGFTDDDFDRKNKNYGFR